jgi:hypothetical protein
MQSKIHCVTLPVTFSVVSYKMVNIKCLLSEWVTSTTSSVCSLLITTKNSSQKYMCNVVVLCVSDWYNKCSGSLNCFFYEFVMCWLYLTCFSFFLHFSLQHFYSQQLTHLLLLLSHFYFYNSTPNSSLALRQLQQLSLFSFHLSQNNARLDSFSSWRNPFRLSVFKSLFI